MKLGVALDARGMGWNNAERSCWLVFVRFFLLADVLQPVQSPIRATLLRAIPHAQTITYAQHSPSIEHIKAQRCCPLQGKNALAHRDSHTSAERRRSSTRHSAVQVNILKINARGRGGSAGCKNDESFLEKVYLSCFVERASGASAAGMQYIWSTPCITVAGLQFRKDKA